VFTSPFALARIIKMSLILNSDTSLRDQWAHEHVARGIKKVYDAKIAKGHPESKLQWGEESEIPDPLRHFLGVEPAEDRLIEGPKVGIIGAGSAGLFTGMILDYLNKKFQNDGFHVGYDILEAAGSDRVGGRLFTHYFTGQPQGKHDYYDVGAMRFPDNPIMQR
jgi:hypothetical protein